MRLNIVSAEGRELAGQWGIRAVPTLLVFNGYGREVLRQVGRPQKESVLASLAEIEGR